MKKTQKLIFAVVTMVLSLFLLTACGLQTHMHDYSEWGYNDENHWMYCKDDNVKDDATVAAHTFTECGTDETYHWMYCPTCGAIQQSSKGSHVDEDLDGKCDVCEYKVPVYVNFGGKVTLIKGGSAAVSTNEGVTISVSDDQGEVDLKNFVFNEDGTFSFTAEEGEYTIEASKDGYMTAVGVIELDHEAEITDYDQLKLEYKLLQVSLKPNYDPSLHDFSHMNEEKPYIVHTYSGGSGKTLDVETVLPQDNAMFTWYAEKGHAVANKDRIGVWVKFYDASMSKSEFVWFQTIGDDYSYAVYSGGMWATATNMLESKSTYSAQMSAAEQEQFDAGTLELSLGRYENLIFVIVNGELRDTIVLDEKYATMDAYLGLVGWDVSATDGQNKFYFRLTEDVSKYLPTEKYNVTIPAAENVTVTANREIVYKGQKVIYTITPDNGYMLVSVKVNGVEKLDDMSNQQLTLENYTDKTTIEIETLPETETDILVTAHEVYEGAEITFVKNGESQIVTIKNGQATFHGLTGYWTAEIKLNGKTYDFGKHFVDTDGNLVIDGKARISSVVELDNITYTTNNKKAVAEMSLVTGEGTVRSTMGNMLRNRLIYSYDKVAVTMYLDPSMRSTAEELGAMMAFEKNFVWFGITGKNQLAWLTNTWHDGDGGNHSKNITQDSSPVLFETLTAADQALLTAGKLPVTLVRDGVMIYAFVNGRYAGYVKVADTYAEAQVRPGFSGLGTRSGAAFDFVIDDGSKWLDICSGATDFEVEVKGEGLEYLVIEGAPADGVYNLNEKYTLTFTTTEHPNAPTNKYSITAFKVNGTDADYSKPLEYIFYSKTTEQRLELYVVVEQTGPIDVTVTADSFFNGRTVTLTMDETTENLTFADGKAEFNGLPGAYKVVFNYCGIDFDLGNMVLNKNGSAELANTTVNNLTYDNKTYPDSKNHKAKSTFELTTGKGTATTLMDNGGFLRHVTLTSYDDVAVTVWMDWTQLSSSKEESGALLFFDSEYVLFGFADKQEKTLSWQTNNWHDGNGGNHVTSITKDSSKCTNYLYRNATLTDAEFTLYKQGKLPITLVRQGKNVYVFVNGAYAARSVLADTYADKKVQVGVSALGLVANASYDFQVETDISEYLEKCTGEATVAVDVKGTNSDALVITGRNEAYTLGDKVSLTFSVKEHEEATAIYRIASMKVNGSTVDATKAYTKYLTEKTTTLDIEVVIEEVKERGTFEGVVKLHKQGAYTIAKDGFTLKLMRGEEVVTLEDYNLAADGTVSFKALSGTYTLVVTYNNNYIKYSQEITLSEANPITDYEAILEYNLMKMAKAPNCDAALHNFTYQNEEKAYVLHTGNVSGKKLDCTTVDSVDNVIFSHYLKRGQSANNEGKVGILVQFYETNGKCHYLWLYAKSNDYKFEWYKNDLWTMYGLNRSGWGFQNGTRSNLMTDEEKAQYEAGTLKISVARAGNMIYAFINDALADTIILNDRYAKMDCYLGLCAFDPCDANGENKFYFDIKDFNPAQVTASVSVPDEYEGKELVFVTNTTETATVVEGKASFKAMPGLCKAYLRYQGDDYYLATIKIAADGTAEIPEGTVVQYIDPENMTYPASHKATSTIDLATGEGTITALGTVLRHRSTVEYDNVAFTVYLNYNNLGDSKEESGLMMVFDNTDYIWYGIAKASDKNLAWHTNNWHDGDGKYFANAINSQLTKTVLSSTLTDAEVAMYKKGTLPMTLVRSGEYVYTLVNGRLTGYAKLPAKYASQKVKVGISGLGVVTNSTYNFKVDTNVRTAAANLTVTVTGDNSEGLVITGQKDSYAVGEYVELTFDTKTDYILKSFTINGSAFDATETYRTYVYGTTGTLNIDVELVKVVTTEITLKDA